MTLVGKRRTVLEGRCLQKTLLLAEHTVQVFQETTTQANTSHVHGDKTCFT